jgi:signal peptidase I
LKIVKLNKIKGTSLEPLILSGTQVKLLKGYYQCNPFQRGDLIVFKLKTRDELFIKKLIGLPGDKIEFENDYLKLNGKILRNSANQPYKFSEQSKRILKIPLKQGKIPSGKYLVLSDKTSASSFDSRQFGYLEKIILIKLPNNTRHLKGFLLGET